MLPLPLPIPVRMVGTNPDDAVNVTDEKLKSEAKQLIRERKLWSAHLHPQSQQIVRLLEVLAFTSLPPLQKILMRVCLQLADLAPNMTLLISKTLSDLLCNEWNTINSNSNQQQQPTMKLSINLLLLLQFYTRLNGYASMKISTLSILSGKLWDVLQSLLALKVTDEKTSDSKEQVTVTTTTTTTSSSSSSSSSDPLNSSLIEKCQVLVHRMIESFLDTEISFVNDQQSPPLQQQQQQQPINETTLLLNLASALPPKELLPRIVESIFNNLMQSEVTTVVSAMALKNLIILTEYK